MEETNEQWKLLDLSSLPTKVPSMSSIDRSHLYNQSAHSFVITRKRSRQGSSPTNTNINVSGQRHKLACTTGDCQEISSLSELITVLFFGIFQCIFFIPIIWYIYGIYLLFSLASCNDITLTSQLLFKPILFLLLHLFFIYYPHTTWPKMDDNLMFFNVAKYFSFRISYPLETQKYLLHFNGMHDILHSLDTSTSHTTCTTSSACTSSTCTNTKSDHAPVSPVSPVSPVPPVPAIVVAVPHGVIPLATAMSRVVNPDIFGKQFVGAAADIVLKLPILRTFMLWWGVVSVSKKSLMRCLEKKQCVALIGDGISGMFANMHGRHGRHSRHTDKTSANNISSSSSDSKEYVVLLKRKGVAKLALQTGCNIIPSYGFGNTKVYDAWYDPWGVMRYMSSKLRMSILFFTGRWGLVTVPKKVALYMCVGNVVKNPYASEKIKQPTEEQIDELHGMMLEEIKHIFDANKELYGWKEKELVFV